MKRTVGLVRLSDKLKGHFFHPNIIHVIVPWHSGVVGDGGGGEDTGGGGDGSWIDGNSEGVCGCGGGGGRFGGGCLPTKGSLQRQWLAVRRAGRSLQNWMSSENFEVVFISICSKIDISKLNF